jgi:hypothetical protein
MIVQNVQEAVPSGRTPNMLFTPLSDQERGEVRDQLRRILSSPVFHNSKRYASVLKFVVDQTLMGFGDRLKERTIGIEVFDRPPDYDTATDHAVRSAVAEVRKRLAQYYLNGGRRELRIEIQPGSYMPQFRWGEEGPHLAALPAHIATVRAESITAQPPGDRDSHKKRWIRTAWIAVSSVILVAGITAWLMANRSPDTLESFWKPLLSSRSPVLLCIGNVEGGEQPPAVDSGSNYKLTVSDYQNSPIATVNEFDSFALARFAGLLQANGRLFKFASQSDATFTDLQSGPAILVGLLNNNWTERLVPRLRFTVDEPTPYKYVIRDRNRPSDSQWTVDYTTPYMNLTKDYAIVLRMVDPKTEQTVIVAAGITVFGTSAASEFLTNRKEIRKIAAIAPPGWERKNMELVLSTDVIRGESGPASIVAAQFW